MAIQDIYQAVLSLDIEKVKQLVQRELDSGASIEAVLNDGLIAAMDEVGQKFSDGDLFVPEMLRAAHAMKGGLAILKPLLAGKASVSRGTIVIGSVKGDLHDIGKNLVSMMFEGAGYQVHDIGVDITPEAFVDAAREHHAQVVALSALLTTTMPSMKTTVEAIKQAGIPAKTIIGGAPVTQAFADKIGADGYADDAPGAVELVKKLIRNMAG